MSAARHERLPDWEQRLSNFLTAHQHRPFEWGQWDCILFACAAVAEMTGHDAAAAYRGRYTDAQGAALALRELGKGTLLKTVDHEFEAKPVARAIRGDLIWHAGCVGICVGANAAFLTDPALDDIAGAPRLGSYVLLPRALWQKAWSV
jgi:hypothetical protein